MILGFIFNITTQPIFDKRIECAFRNVYLIDHKNDFKDFKKHTKEILENEKLSNYEKIYNLRLKFNLLPIDDLILRGINFVSVTCDYNLTKSDKDSLIEKIIENYNITLKGNLIDYSLQKKLKQEYLVPIEIFFNLLNLKQIHTFVDMKVNEENNAESSSTSTSDQYSDYYYYEMDEDSE